MEKRILVPLDGTATGEAVLPKLEELILMNERTSGAEINLIRVIPIVNFNVLTEDEKAQLPYNESELKELNQEAQDYLGRIASGLQKKGFVVQTMVRVGHAAEEIVKAANEIKANLIAMSTHSRSGFIRWAIGSVSDRVLKLEGEIPVLAVHPAQKDEKSSVIPLNSLQSLMKHS